MDVLGRAYPEHDRRQQVMEAAMQNNRMWAFAVGLIAAAAIFSSANAQQRYKTPEEGADALVAAARAGDQKAIAAILGPGGADIASSGDAVQDDNTRKLFVAAYDVKHTVTVTDNKAVMVLGDQDWPFPIPLVKKGDTWQFDTPAGRQEVLFRRIGRNELSAIQVALAYVDAQHEYAEMKAADGAYAQRVVSSPGKKDGLYWPNAAGEQPSPIGEAVAVASLTGYRIGSQEPFHGYYYKILTRQGPNAPRGAQDYVVRGKMIGGFALIAYPAEYANSGVMTFVVNHDGVVFQKDLGRNTAKIAAAITAYNPDHTWQKVAEITEEPAKPGEAATTPKAPEATPPKPPEAPK
jgi:hypothetical protein